MGSSSFLVVALMRLTIDRTLSSALILVPNITLTIIPPNNPPPVSSPALVPSPSHAWYLGRGVWRSWGGGMGEERGGSRGDERGRSKGDERRGGGVGMGCWGEGEDGRMVMRG